MPEQTRRNYTKARKAQEQEAADRVAEKVKPKERGVEDIDAMLDDIDEVLEENAETMVAEFIQHGGE